MVITYLPGVLGMGLRRRYWRARLARLGENVRIDVGVHFENPERIFIGDNSWIDRGCVILAGVDESTREKILVPNDDYDGPPGSVSIGSEVHIGVGGLLSGISSGIQIGDGCTFSAGCKIFAFSHHYRSGANPGDDRFGFGSMIPHDRQCMIEGPITLGRNTGVALNSVILPGAAIAENCFVAVNSVVHKGSYPPNSMLSGAPAQRIGPRFAGDA
jgi:acetyltransferase-like isoleucine patch superfamily enzyme